MSSLKMLMLLICITSMCACSLFEPFVDRRRNAGAENKQRLYVGRSKPDQPAICYNGLWTNEEKLQAMADSECQKQGTGDHAEKINETFLSCRIFLPSHAYYQCVDSKQGK